MNDLTKKAGTHAAAIALGASLSFLSPDKAVKVELPPDSSIIAYDANGTDGKDPSKLLTIVQIPREDGSLRIIRLRADGSRVKGLGEQ